MDLPCSSTGIEQQRRWPKTVVANGSCLARIDIEILSGYCEATGTGSIYGMADVLDCSSVRCCSMG